MTGHQKAWAVILQRIIYRRENKEPATLISLESRKAKIHSTMRTLRSSRSDSKLQPPQLNSMDNLRVTGGPVTITAETSRVFK